jgi:hypothetical protein
MCKGCQESSSDMKTRWCIDCGKEFIVDIRNMTKCRCDECQHEHRKEWDRERKRQQKEQNSTFVI